MYKIYVLKSKVAKKSYVGHTDNIERRINEHNSGRNIYTSRYIPWEVVYNEDYKTKEEAIKREKFFKTTRGRRALKRIFDRLGLN